MQPNVQLSPANEDYLEAIVELASELGDDEGVRSVDIASLLNVSKASVNKAVHMLKEAGYITQEHYGKIELTEAGRIYGESVWRRHRALRHFLVDQLGVDPEIAEEEACMMEHAISDKTMDLWVEYMNRVDRLLDNAQAQTDLE